MFAQSQNCSIEVSFTQKVSDTEGGFTGILGDTDLFGQEIEPIGDLDGDGISDIAVSAHYSDDGGYNRGAIWINFMNIDGTVKLSQKISDTQGGFLATFYNDDSFGTCITNLGDLDGDGITDIAVGSFRNLDGGGNKGAVYILFLNTNGTVKGFQKISDTQGNFTASLSHNGAFGRSIANIGDLDNNGVIDLAVGAAQDDDGGTDRGCVYILFLNSDGTVSSHQKISSTVGNLGATLDNEDYFGLSLTALNDFDGDGIEDIMVGAVSDDDGGIDRGAVYILKLNMDGTVKSVNKISSTAGAFQGSIENNDAFGTDMSMVGDVDGNGVNDVIVSAQNDDGSGTDIGGFWLLLLNIDGTVKSEKFFGENISGISSMLNNSDKLGNGIAYLGDSYGDNRVDIALGAWFDDDGGTDRGAYYIISLEDSCDTDCNNQNTFIKTFGGSADDIGHSIMTTSDGNYISVGLTSS